MTFSQLGLSEAILQVLDELTYRTPTAIQKEAIPAIMAGRDVLASAATGTGKTASFVLPLLNALGGEHKRRAKRLRALILVPTRELAEQVNTSIFQYGKYIDCRSTAMYGGVSSAPQKQCLIDGIDILVATPGRLLDMLHQRALHFDELKFLVLDEADKMLDMGFIGDINKIIDRLPERRQNLLFSATLSDSVRSLAKTAINDPVELSVPAGRSNETSIEQWLITVDKDRKSALLSYLITEFQWQQALIFIRTRAGAAKLVSQLEKRGIKAEAIHSGRSQASRAHILTAFKSGEIAFLVATGIAARGLDIEQLDRVVNYDLPDDAEEYIHRIGRTGRAGASGEAISLVSKDDFKRLCAIEHRMQQLIDRNEIEGFSPKKVVPISVLNHVKKRKPNTSRQATSGNNTNPWSPWDKSKNRNP